MAWAAGFHLGTSIADRLSLLSRFCLETDYRLMYASIDWTLCRLVKTSGSNCLATLAAARKVEEWMEVEGVAMGPMISRVKEMTWAVLAAELPLEMEGHCRTRFEQLAWLMIVANRLRKNARSADAEVSFELEEL